MLLRSGLGHHLSKKNHCPNRQRKMLVKWWTLETVYIPSVSYRESNLGTHPMELLIKACASITVGSNKPTNFEFNDSGECDQPCILTSRFNFFANSGRTATKFEFESPFYFRDAQLFLDCSCEEMDEHGEPNEVCKRAVIITTNNFTIVCGRRSAAH